MSQPHIHESRLQRLLESNRLTPTASPSSSPLPPSEFPQASSSSASSSAQARKRKGVSRTHPKASLSSLASHSAELNYVVCVSTRNSDVELENLHNLHCLCSFPTRQAAYDYITKHRLEFARHYLKDPALTETELKSNSESEGCYDEFYLGEHASLEIIQVPQFASASEAPNPSKSNVLFVDPFCTTQVEEEHEAELEAEAKTNNGDESIAATKQTRSPANKKRKV